MAPPGTAGPATVPAGRAFHRGQRLWEHRWVFLAGDNEAVLAENVRLQPLSDRLATDAAPEGDRAGAAPDVRDPDDRRAQLADGEEDDDL